MKGRLGEDIAVAFLRERGFGIIMRNYRVKQGEIDIIASKSDILYFIEVKASYCGRVALRERINSRKLIKIRQVGDIWLQKYKHGAYHEYYVAYVEVLKEQKGYVVNFAVIGV